MKLFPGSFTPRGWAGEISWPVCADVQAVALGVRTCHSCDIAVDKKPAVACAWRRNDTYTPKLCFPSRADSVHLGSPLRGRFALQEHVQSGTFRRIREIFINLPVVIMKPLRVPPCFSADVFIRYVSSSVKASKAKKSLYTSVPRLICIIVLL